MDTTREKPWYWDVKWQPIDTNSVAMRLFAYPEKLVAELRIHANKKKVAKLIASAPETARERDDAIAALKALLDAIHVNDHGDWALTAAATEAIDAAAEIVAYALSRAGG